MNKVLVVAVLAFVFASPLWAQPHGVLLVQSDEDIFLVETRSIPVSASWILEKNPPLRLPAKWLVLSNKRALAVFPKEGRIFFPAPNGLITRLGPSEPLGQEEGQETVYLPSGQSLVEVFTGKGGILRITYHKGSIDVTSTKLARINRRELPWDFYFGKSSY